MKVWVFGYFTRNPTVLINTGALARCNEVLGGVSRFNGFPRLSPCTLLTQRDGIWVHPCPSVVKALSFRPPAPVRVFGVFRGCTDEHRFLQGGERRGSEQEQTEGTEEAKGEMDKGNSTEGNDEPT